MRRRLLLHPGEQFSPTAIDKARQDLPSLGVFSVGADRAGRVTWTPQGTLPMTVNVTERPLHSVDVGVAYSTDLGVNFNARLARPQSVRQRRAIEPDRRR